MNALDLVYIPLAAATAPAWARKKRAGWGERFGRVPPLPPSTRPRIMLHAVSVGEVNAIRALVPLLAREAEVVVSVGTDTGIARARELFERGGAGAAAAAEAGASAPAARVVRYPLDFSWSVRRFLGAVRPDAVGLVELEIWPNFVAECRRRGVPVAVVNGRLSERSFTGYRRLRGFFRRSFAALEFAAVQDAAYAARFEAMGVDPGACLITGSMKWDAARIDDAVPGAEELAHELGIARGPGAPPLVVAGSTAEDEEALLHGVCAELERELGPIQLLCAPRKPEHFGEAAAAMPGCARRSARTAAPGGTRRFLLDTIGELRQAYALADAVVIGRSFGTLFGSDPIEPIGLGKPTLIGPRFGDFDEIVRAFAEGGGLVRTTRETLARDLRTVLADRDRAAELARRGRDVIRARRGATARHAELLLSLVGPGRAVRGGPRPEPAAASGAAAP